MGSSLDMHDFTFGQGDEDTTHKMQQLHTTELLDIHCSQCCKKVNLLSDLDARLRNMKRSSQLFQANVLDSNQSSSTDDLFTDSIDSCDLIITEKVSYLEKKVTELESDSLTNGELKSKLRHENTLLVHRVHELEEQMKDAEARANQSLEEEMKRHCEVYCKMESERNTEIEFLCNRIHQLKEENGDMKTHVHRLKSHAEKLDQEKQKKMDKLEDRSLRLKEEMALYRKIIDKVWHNRREFRKEKEAMQELIDDLRRELDYLQLFMMEMEHPGKSKSLSEHNSKPWEMEMEQDVKKLKQHQQFHLPSLGHDRGLMLLNLKKKSYYSTGKHPQAECENHKLRDQNDDLNAQILSLSLYETKSPFSCHTKVQCLAAEIDNASRDEIVDALKEEEENNMRLRKYMDKIILAILDHNPSILEIKC
ncbi:rab11 family-interacting protein 4A isoform X2 [Syngnathoides biaculeatus]|uniref:rab11 family-interacting protein 4A isoform X2 n=1 Tax=Syngnathoides biaculeatus TaxID=300417 RepID=UPI002ADDBA7D|nr:rab11 family-interacting protein 4A isoform X2 [Syngnathoides biaculeatus]